MDARTRALVLAILIGSVLIAAAIYFRPQSDLAKIDPNPCDGPGKHPAEGLHTLCLGALESRCGSVSRQAAQSHKRRPTPSPRRSAREPEPKRRGAASCRPSSELRGLPRAIPYGYRVMPFVVSTTEMFENLTVCGGLQSGLNVAVAESEKSAWPFCTGN